MRINHNIPALNAHRLLTANNRAATGTLERLSSGKRINKAGDDAAGMAISEKMRAQVRGLRTASRNSLDGVSLIQTAEGAMGEVHSMLQRMRELSVQAANGTQTLEDRQAIQEEINQLTSEVNRIANGTEYNTENVLNGNKKPNSNTLVHTMSTGTPASKIGTVDVSGLGATDFDWKTESLSIFINGEEKVVNLTQTDASTDLTNFMALFNDALGKDANAIINDDGHIEIKTKEAGGLQTIKVVASTTVATALGLNNTEVSGTAEKATSTSSGSFLFESKPEIGATLLIGDEVIEFFDSSVAPYVGTNRPVDLNGLADADAVVNNIVSKFAKSFDGVTLTISGYGGQAYPANPVGTAGAEAVSNRLVITADSPGFDGNLTYLEGTLEGFNTTLQVGANSGQEFRMEIGDIRSQKLKISADNPTRNPGVQGAAYTAIATVTDGISSAKTEYAIDVTTEERASAAIKVFNNAIVELSSQRSQLGATQNRLEHTIANLDNTNENLTAALSRIEDADMALEMSEYTKINILQQSGTSMLQKANQSPQLVLQLLQT
jgi:flagellin